MIKANNAIRTARSLLGTPYSEMDCIRLIVMVIRRTPGGDPDYRCEGTNWLWRSIDNAKKYRHLTWRKESTGGAQAGMLAFKKDGDDIHHVGIVTEKGTVIHSSSVYNMAVETPLDGTWHLLAKHRDIDTGGEVILPEPEEETESPDNTSGFTSLIREDGMGIVLAGKWRVAED